MINPKVYNHLLSVRKKKGAGYIVLIDPDRKSENGLAEKVKKINNSDVDAIFVGGDIVHSKTQGISPELISILNIEILGVSVYRK